MGIGEGDRKPEQNRCKSVAAGFRDLSALPGTLCSTIRCSVWPTISSTRYLPG